VNYSSIKLKIRIQRGWAHFLSALFHPLLLPTYIITLLGYFSPLAIAPLNTLEGRNFLISLFFLSTFFLPFLILAFYIMLRTPRWTIRNFFMENPQERVFPFMLVGILYSVLIYFIRLAPQINDLILILMTVFTTAILAVAFISNFWKISAHAVGMGGMISIIGVVNNRVPDAALFYPFLILIVLMGCVLSARLYLNAHTPKQVFAGALLGLILGGFTYIFN
jgi:membrane-associated phospholipid phosphatase